MTVGIVGLGLVGGSLALDLRATERDVVGFDTNPDHARLAAEAGIEAASDLAGLVERADLVVVAVPPGAVARTVQGVAALDPDVVLTDVASVKDPSALGTDRVDVGPRYVGGHPMAGTERTGFAAARRGLLAGATWMLTPTDDVDVEAMLDVTELVLSVGAVPVVVDAAEHDRLVAAVSHVTHLLSFALNDVAHRLGPDVVDLVAGPSFRDATRVAASDPGFWSDVTTRNREAVTEVLSDVRDWLVDALADEPAALTERLAGARRVVRPRSDDTAVVDLADVAAGVARLRELGRTGHAITGVERTGAVCRVAVARR